MDLKNTQRVLIVYGQASATFTGLNTGTYDVSAVYAGATNFNAQTSNATFSLNKIVLACQ